MATRNFAINTEPHLATIGDQTLAFEPEVIGAEFATSYDKLRNVQKKVSAAEGNKSSSTKHAKSSDIDASVMAELSDAMREFVAEFLLPESRPVFAGMRLPNRILVQLIEWIAELYGGGSGNDGGGTSSN